MRNTAWTDKVTYVKMKFFTKKSRFSHEIRFLLKYGLGRKNYMKVKCFHEKVQIFTRNKMVFRAKYFHVIFWVGDLFYKNSILVYVLKYDKIWPTKLILEMIKNAAQVKCGLGRFLK